MCFEGMEWKVWSKQNQPNPSLQETHHSLDPTTPSGQTGLKPLVPPLPEKIEYSVLLHTNDNRLSGFWAVCGALPLNSRQNSKGPTWGRCMDSNDHYRIHKKTNSNCTRVNSKLADTKKEKDPTFHISEGSKEQSLREVAYLNRGLHLHWPVSLSFNCLTYWSLNFEIFLSFKSLSFLRIERS